MYYQVMLKAKNQEIYEFDRTDIAKIETDIIDPIVQNETFMFSGYFIKPKDVERIVVRETNQTADSMAASAMNALPRNVIAFISKEDIVLNDKYGKDISRELINKNKQKVPIGAIASKNEHDLNSKVFIVHGRDKTYKDSVARLLEKLFLHPIILHEQPNQGRTVIEKFIDNAIVGFAVVILTADDKGGVQGTATKKNLHPRARQNVVLELGYFMGKLGRKRVCALYQDGVELPSDYVGVLYIPLDAGDAWKTLLAKELKAAGYDVDLNKAL